MKRFYNKSNFLVVRLSMLTTVLFLTSCSTDAVTDPDAIIVAEEEHTKGDSNENFPDEATDVDNEDVSGTITFEEGFLLDEARKMTKLTLSPAAYVSFLNGEGDLRLVSRKVYEYLNDDFDFLIILSIEANQPAGLFFGRSTTVQNQVAGLGGSTFTNTAAYGSNERLKSIIYMPRSEYVRNGPFLHEIAHTWANKGFIPTTVGGHWGYSSAGGQLGGFDAVEELSTGRYQGKLNGSTRFGTNANGGNSLPYSTLELYLMGLIGADELETIQVAVNPEKGTAAGEFTADSMEAYTSARLISDNGERVPSHLNAQKEFKALVVIISSTAVSEEKTAEIQANLENFSRNGAPDESWGNLYNFWRATEGKASFDFTIDQATIK